MENRDVEVVDFVWTNPKGADRVTVPPGGKFEGVYWCQERRQYFAIVHHPIAPGAATETISGAAAAGGTITVGVTTQKETP